MMLAFIHRSNRFSCAVVVSLLWNILSWEKENCMGYKRSVKGSC